MSETVKKLLIELEVPEGSPVHEKPVVAIDFPDSALIALLQREKRYLTVSGSTKLRAHDKLLVMMNARKDLKAIQKCLGIK